jgi:hypothetical protein
LKPQASTEEETLIVAPSVGMNNLYDTIN